MFYDKFLALCIKKNMSPSAAAIDAGFSNAAAAGWKKGAVPRESAIKKLADYFGVPVSYFSEDTEKQPAVSGELPIKSIIVEAWNEANEEERKLMEDVARMIKARRENK